MSNVYATPLALLFALASACAATAPLSPKAVELNRTGSEALAQGNLELAEVRFTLALEYHPRFVEALTNLGLLEMQRGNLERARVHLERARRINSDLAQPHHGLGVLEERVRRPDRAAEHYRDALKVDPGFYPSRINLGRILFAAGQLDEAREQFLKVVDHAPAELAGYTGLAETMLRLGRENDCDAVVRTARERGLDGPELDLLDARRALRTGDTKEARENLERLASGSGDIAGRARSWLAVACLEAEDPKGALAAAGRAFEIDRDDPLATYVTAMALLRLNDRRALAWLERAEKLAPHHLELARALAGARGKR
jgi:tetratricopeptide (TPR) repeat protein